MGSEMCIRDRLEEVQRDLGIREKERDAAIAQRVTAQTAFDDLRASVATDEQEVQGLRVRLGEAEKARDDVIAERSKLEVDLQTWKGASVENQRLRAQLVYEKKKSQDRLSLLDGLQRQFQKVSGDYRSLHQMIALAESDMDHVEARIALRRHQLKAFPEPAPLNEACTKDPRSRRDSFAPAGRSPDVGGDSADTT